MEEQVVEQGGEEQGAVETQEQFGSFFSALPDELKSDPTLQNFKNAEPDVVAKTLINQQKLIGRDKIPLPNWTDESDVNRFYDALGVPNAPDKYELGEYDWAKEAGYDNNVMREIAHKNKLTADQARGIEKMYLEDIRANIERAQQEAEERRGESEQKLRTQWGEKFDEKMAIKDAVVDRFARTPEAAQALKDLAKSNPDVAASLADIGSKFSQHSIGDFQVKQNNISPQAAQEQIDAMRGDMSGPYWDDTDRVAHSNAVKKMLELESIVAASN